MARARNIKPGFFTNDVLGELPPLARLLFAGLWTVCDRAGRVEDRPKKIKAEVLPYDACDPDELLTMLEAAGFIARYQADGVRVIQVLAWDKHQNPHMKEAASTLPAPDKHGASTVQALDKTQPIPERAGLIPDSGFLIPDSLNQDTHTEDSVTVGAPTAAGRACLLLRKSGISGVSPGHPKLLALLAAGVTDEELTHAAQSAVSKGKGFAYAMGALEAQRREAAAMTLHAGPLPGKTVTVASDAAEKTAAMLAEQAARKAEPPSDAIREKLRAAKGVAALAGFAVKVAA